MVRDNIKSKIDIYIIIVGYQSQHVLVNYFQSIMQQKDCALN